MKKSRKNSQTQTANTIKKRKYAYEHDREITKAIKLDFQEFFRNHPTLKSDGFRLCLSAIFSEDDVFDATHSTLLAFPWEQSLFVIRFFLSDPISEGLPHIPSPVL